MEQRGMVKKYWKRGAAFSAVILMMTMLMGLTSFAGGWRKSSYGWWWLDDNGTYPINQWRWLDGNGDGVAECYCFDGWGYIYQDTVTPDGYKVNGDGAWVMGEGNFVQTKAVAAVPQGSGGGQSGQTTQKQAVNNTVTNNTAQASLVPINQLANRASLQKKCTNQEFQAAYNAAVKIVTPLIGLSREKQLQGISKALRAMVDDGTVAYSTSANHYNDPYGYLILGVASCAGCARTTGLCLNMLGIPYEHVNENQWSHQWCRVNVNGTYWICDAYGLYVGPEPAPYRHPIY